MPMIRPDFLAALAACLTLTPAWAEAPSPRLITVTGEARSLGQIVIGLETVTAALAAADDATLTDAMLSSLRTLAQAAGDACTLNQSSLDEEAEERAMVTHLVRALGLDLEVTPEIAVLFTTPKKTRTMINTLKDEAGSLPGTAGYLVRIDAVKAGMDQADDRLGALMKGAMEAGRVSIDGYTMKLAGEGCPG